MKETDICSYCDNVDSVEHFLYECTRVQQIWVQLVAWFRRQLNIDIDVSQDHFFLGLPSSCKNFRIVNSLILYFKYYVHREKLFHNCEMSLTSLLS